MSRSEVEFGLGAILIGCGFCLFLGLPPNWWPRMALYLVHVGLLVSLVFIITGVLLATIGACRYGAEHHIRLGIVSWWDHMWTAKRVMGVGVVFLLCVAIGPVFWPTPAQSVTARPSGQGALSNKQSGGQTGSTINNNGPTYNAPVTNVAPKPQNESSDCSGESTWSDAQTGNPDIPGGSEYGIVVAGSPCSSFSNLKIRGAQNGMGIFNSHSTTVSGFDYDKNENKPSVAPAPMTATNPPH